MNDQVKTVLLLGLLSLLLIGLGGVLGTNYLYGFTIMAIVMNFVSYFYSDKIVLSMNGAQEVSMEEAPRLHSIVEELAARANLPKPRVYMIPQAQPNAFATGRNPQHSAVAVTQGIMQLLNERELRGVIAHELGHVVNRDILITSIAATIASAVTFIGHALQWGAMFAGSRDDDERGSPLGALALAIVAPLAATIIQLAISRSREFEADATGARLCGDPESLARALEKLERGAEAIPADVAPATASMYIVNPFSGAKTFMNWFSTHPPMEERIARLRGMMLDGASLAGSFQGGR
ncbi:MAG: protease [Acidobacteriales bacterium]|nr:protease [Terriglobales bacterium]